jgi:hypothetical protein
LYKIGATSLLYVTFFAADLGLVFASLAEPMNKVPTSAKVANAEIVKALLTMICLLNDDQSLLFLDFTG